MKSKWLLMVVLGVAIIACTKTEEAVPAAPIPPTPQGLVDIDGNSYDTVVIGNQTWMAENLRVRRFRNGDPIPFDTLNAYWGTLETFCTVLDNDMANAAQYGLLYNYNAVTDTRGICPDGWHPGSDADWGALELALGMDPAEVEMNSYPGYGERGVAANVSGKLKAIEHWPTLDGTVSNSSGMTILPARSRWPHNGGFSTSAHAYFWTPGNSGWYRQLSDGTSGVIRKAPSQSGDTPGAGYSCRCVKD